MRYGISAGVLVVQEGTLLLVHHREPGAYDFWVPPGGHLEGAESIYDCARREAFEETGLRVAPETIVYVQEFVDHDGRGGDVHSCKLWLWCPTFTGTLTPAHRVAEEASFLVEARFMAREDLRGLTVYPPVVRDLFWDDLRAGFPKTRYLGLDVLTSP